MMRWWWWWWRCLGGGVGGWGAGGGESSGTSGKVQMTRQSVKMYNSAAQGHCTAAVLQHQTVTTDEIRLWIVYNLRNVGLRIYVCVGLGIRQKKQGI